MRQCANDIGFWMSDSGFRKSDIQYPASVIQSLANYKNYPKPNML